MATPVGRSWSARRASLGVRALTHSAFYLALLQFCDDRELPHPGLAVIDSPLVVYREPDEEGLALRVKEAFYRDLAETFSERQVIILENEDPPDDLSSVSNLIPFTGADHGRTGFFPV